MWGQLTYQLALGEGLLRTLVARDIPNSVEVPIELPPCCYSFILDLITKEVSNGHKESSFS